ncbi:HVO_0234 family beta-propeller protein [Halalkalicoccus subterraneus]|uniref:HVO_0234 family beta-propeller protein n=1 Tax=Halalkalicoccus subterraneus TaxID=2675002 RepID=UPI000EFBC7B9|nr:hypothetical protein [Halalkalicoccus subterraneus]
MSTATESGENGFLTFYREYAHTGLHTITATALTAFGLLTFVHRGFVVLAIAVYVIPPVYLYLTRNGEAPKPVDGDGETQPTDASDRPATSEPVDGEIDDDDPAASVSDGDRRPDREEPATTGSTTDTGSGRRNEGAPETASGAATNSGDGDDIAGSGGSEPADVRGERSEPAPAAGTAHESESNSAPSNPDTSGVSDADDGSAADDALGLDGEDREDGSEPAEWVEADGPTEEALLDTTAVGESAYAAGEGGVLLARAPGEEWELALESGPAAESTILRGVDATDEGEAVWVAGDGGVLGRYDPAAGRHTDHSAPEGITDNWADLAVAGTAGEERLALVNGSGQVLVGEYEGSEVAWDDPVKPGSGSSMSTITFLDESLGYCCDTNAGVYRIEGSEFERVGIENTSGFGALAATADAVVVAGDDGTVQRFDGSVWTPVRVDEDPLSGLAVGAGGAEWLAVGAGGAVFENRDGDWEAVDSPTDADLFAVASGKRSVAVGEDGTLLERAR